MRRTRIAAATLTVAAVGLIAAVPTMAGPPTAPTGNVTLTESSTTPCLLTATFNWGPRGNKYVGKSDLAGVSIATGGVGQDHRDANPSGQAGSVSVTVQAQAAAAQQWNASAALIGSKGQGGDIQVNVSDSKTFNCAPIN